VLTTCSLDPDDRTKDLRWPEAFRPLSIKHKTLIYKEITMKLRPLQDRIIVKRVDQEKTTASGIVIPDNAAEKPDQGEVIAVGNGKVLEDGKVLPLDVKVGDIVLFGKYSGQTVKVEGEELLVMHESDVMAIVQN
jgi:chaperonin 10 Kd subunit